MLLFNPRIFAFLFYTFITAHASASETTRSISTDDKRADQQLVQATLIELLEGEPIAVEDVKFAKFKQPNVTTGTIIFEPASLDWKLTSQSAVINWEEHFKRLTNDQKRGLESAALDLVRRVEAHDTYTTPTAAQLDPRIRLYDAPQWRRRRFMDEPQVFWVYPPGYSADGQFALVHTASTWSGHMHSCMFSSYFARVKGRWVFIGRASVYFV